MIFHQKLTRAGIVRLSNLYIISRLQAGAFIFQGNDLYVKLNYHHEDEYLHVARVDGDLSSDVIKAGLINSIIDSLEARIK